MSNSPPPTRRTRRWLSRLIRLSVAGLVLYYLLSRVDLALVSELLGRINGWPLLAMLAINFTGIAIMTQRMQIAMTATGHTLPFGPMYRLAFAGIFFNNFAPGTIGADAYRMLALRSMTGSGVAAAAGTALFRMTGIGGNIVVMIGALAVNRWVWNKQVILVPLLVIVVALIALLSLALFHPTSLFLGLHKLKWGWSQRLAEKGDRLHDAFAQIRSQPGAIARCLGLSVAAHLVWAMRAYFLYYALGQAVPIPVLVLCSSTLTMTLVLPFTFAIWGGAEFVFYHLYLTYGLEKSMVISAAIILRLFATLFSLLSGGFYFLFLRNSPQPQ